MYRIPQPKNEPILNYAPGSPERAALKEAIKFLKANPIDVPLVIGGQEIKTDHKIKITAPHDHNLLLGHYYQGGEKEVKMAVEAAVEAQKSWQHMPWEQRSAIFLRAADLISTKYRYIMNAAAMLAHSKTAHQAEIDAVAELADFYRFNCWCAQQIYDTFQPESSPGVWNRIDHRPLEGFVFAVTPFNFISINGNLPVEMKLKGGVSVWKPASTATYTSHWIMKILREAGLPDGVVNLLFAKGRDIGELVLKSRHLAGIHFTGSTPVFQMMWKTVGDNLPNYNTYPRLVGETGGKDFIIAHPSADVDAVVANTIRGAFEFQGQKCSAASRCYFPESLWPTIKQKMIAELGTIKMGDVENFGNFMGAVIDGAAFKSITEYIDYAKQHKDKCEIVFGGRYDDSKGWFIEPTVVATTDPHFRLMVEEIFGPVLTIYVYKDAEYANTLHLCDQTSPYSLTGAVFARDRMAVALAERTLRHAAGNFYINDKPTGAVVGQQPFGGGRASGTNDKAGAIQNMMRWISPRTVKENFIPPTDYRYPFLKE